MTRPHKGSSSPTSDALACRHCPPQRRCQPVHGGAAFLDSIRSTSLNHCAETSQAHAILDRNAARRENLIRKARLPTRLLSKRSHENVLGKSHNQTQHGYSQSTDVATVFSGNILRILIPEETLWPYRKFLARFFHNDAVREHVRRNVIDGQKSVDLVLDYQVIDVDTRKPIPNFYVEIWYCNSMGIYSSVVAGGNSDSTDESNISATFLRGIQATDGSSPSLSPFPRPLRGPHNAHHVMVHADTTLYENQKLGTSTYASHIGQAFFHQSLVFEVKRLEAYHSKKQVLTSNTEDMILSQAADKDGVDPLMQYTLMGDGVSDSLFVWVALGINTSFPDLAKSALFLYKSGGVKNAYSGPGGMGGPPLGTISSTSGASASASQARWSTRSTRELAIMASFFELTVFF